MHEVVKDRNAEIMKLREPPDTREFRRLIAEMAGYLDETEIRQERQANILKDIGNLIKVDFSDRVVRLKHALKVTMTELEIVVPLSEKPKPGPMVSKGVNTDPPSKMGARKSRIVTRLVEEAKAKATVDEVRIEHAQPEMKPIPKLTLAEAVASSVVKLIDSHKEASINQRKPDQERQSVEVTPSKANEEVEHLKAQLANYGLDIPEAKPMSRVTLEISVQTTENWPTQSLSSSYPLQAPVKHKPKARASTSHNKRKESKQVVRVPLPPIEDDETPNIVEASLLIEPLSLQYPMIEANLYRLFEATMDEKAKFDAIDFEQGRPLRHMVECQLDFLYKQYGLKNLALKNLSALLEGLRKYAQQPYAQLYCRMLCVFTSQPIGTMLGAFIVKARIAFNNSLRVSRTRSLTKGSPETGGDAYLAEVLDCIPKLFTGSSLTRQAGEIIVHKLLKDKDFGELLPALLANKLAKIGLDLNAFFNKLNPDSQGFCSIDAFVDGIQDFLDLWLPKAALHEVCRAAFPDGSVSLPQVLANLIPKDALLVLQSKAYIATKSDFLIYVIEAIEETDAAQIEALKAAFASYAKEFLTCEEFIQLVLRLSPTAAPPDQLRAMFYAFAESPADPSSLVPESSPNEKSNPTLQNLLTQRESSQCVNEASLSLEGWMALVKHFSLVQTQTISEQGDQTDHDQIIDHEHPEGHLAVIFKRKNTKFLKRR